MLGLQIFTDADKTSMLADFSGRCHLGAGRGFSFTTNEHGFDSLTVPLVPMNIYEAFDCYTWPGTPHVVVMGKGVGTVWEGRLEDITIVEGGISLVAFGYQRALRDVPYTGFFSKSGTGGFHLATDDDTASSIPEKWVTDNNNRIFVALRQGETYANGADVVWDYGVPDGSETKIKGVTFDYSATLPTDFRFYGLSFDSYASIGQALIVTGNGSNQSGSYSINFGTARYFAGIRILNNSGSAYDMTAETGTYFLKVTNYRATSIAYGTPVVASDIAESLVAHIASVNPGQLSTDTSLIKATTTDLYDEIYEDAYHADILDRLALLHGYEWGVYEGQRLHFRERGSAGRAWAVDATEIISMQRSLEPVRNSAYGIYRDANGVVQRTAVADDDASQTQYGIVRRGKLDVRTTSNTEAETHRDVYLTDNANSPARAMIRFSRIYDASGGEYPLYALRAGDTLTIRNLPPNLNEGVDDIRTFIVAETNYDAWDDTITATPREAIPQLDRLIARREAGLR